MRISRLLLIGAALAHAAAAETPPGQAAPTTASTTGPGGGACLFAGPMLGTNLLSLHFSSREPWDMVTGYLPGLRLGMELPTGFIAGEANLGLGASVAGYGQLSLKLGGTYGHDLFKLGPMQGYGLGGLNLGLAGTIPSGFVPTSQLSFGAGLEYDIGPGLKLATEGGLRLSMALGSSSLGGPQLETTASVFLGVVGEYSLPGTTCHPGTTERPPAGGPTVVVEEVPKDPHTTPGPTYPSSTATPCSSYPVDGWFEPSQGVWQDDLSFDDRATKQLTRAPFGGIAYQAELNMVQNKDSLLFGVHHYQLGGGPVIVDSRDFIVIKGYSNCPDPKPVQLRFTLREGGAEREIYKSPIVATIPLEGAALPQYKPWEARLPVRAGVPDAGTFQFRQAGPYQLKAELQRGDTGALTGLFMTVDGRTVQTMGPIVHFVPVMLSQLTSAEEGSLQLLTETVARNSELRIPDVFPVAPGGLPTSVKVIRNFTNLAVGDRWFEFRRISYTVAALNDSLASSVFLSGAGRIVAVMNGKDFRSIFGKGAAGMTVSESVKVKARGESARTLSWKVMLIPSYETWDTVAHEIVHTLPEGWAEDGMKAECGKAYHNTHDPFAHGERITQDSVPAAARERKVALVSIMGPSIAEKDLWMDQCTYWHLLGQLDGGPPDPPVVMLRAFVGKKGSKVVGELKPAYELMGHADLAAQKGGPYAFVFKDAAGKELARFPFTPRSADIETREPLDLVSVVYRVPLVHDWAQLELQGPGNAVLDRKARSAAPPQVTITSPGDGGPVTPQDGKVRLTWEGAGAGPLLYSVLYSSDGGKRWTDQSFEQTGTSFDVLLAREPKGKDHRLKVVATDGTRSAEAVIKVAVTGP